MPDSFHIIIPARIGSSRLPRKALAEIAGRPLVLHTLARARQARASSVCVATDSQEIADVVSADGGEVVMTRADHPSGTDRLAEVVEHLDLDDGDIVVNLQGDEPGMPAACLHQVAELLASDPSAQMSTLWRAVDSEAQWRDPNVVKLVADRHQRALYFSRAPIPHVRDGGWPSDLARRHVGLYAYRAAALRAWQDLPEADLERLESLEQLRALAAGWRILVAEACQPIPVGVDTHEDLARLRVELDT
ncbi:MAG: 3-deoxy-manno-octulosonate cytidylyltransferase [Wenzhouxiangella sp.]